MKKLIISAAVVAASVFGVYTANQNSAKNCDLFDIEQVADGECYITDGSKVVLYCVGEVCECSSLSGWLGRYNIVCIGHRVNH